MDEFDAWAATVPDEADIARPANAPRSHSSPGSAPGVTYEIATTLASLGDSQNEDEHLVAHRWAWFAADRDWLHKFEIVMRHKLADILEVGLPEDKYTPLSSEVFEEAHNAPSLGARANPPSPLLSL